MKTTPPLLAILLAVPAFASPVWDLDDNGLYTMEEVAIVYPRMTEQEFMDLDTDASSDLSQAEMKAANNARLLDRFPKLLRYSDES